ncbi:hypothetical protein RFI_16188 [Reticulomyxa filosa]|uniref:Cleavage and polyadenylation specificity factor subunit 5 n=1 Tax=Reticulomyxa filosa TaxID=46433 RepID=X6N4R6_RETFI|nr:hypothetical protein RFI_16188 [Reticulomyxa filosa]|eukprot:ETO21016.1 hypothetical protein RFI_16188 [Reticulomyxa filosa]
MASETFTFELYPLSNYTITEKDPNKFLDMTLLGEISYCKQKYQTEGGMRHRVEAVLLVNYRKHPHVLLFQTCANTQYKLPGGFLEGAEDKYDGLKRILDEQLSPIVTEQSKSENESVEPGSETKLTTRVVSQQWEIAELLTIWWRAEWDEIFFPYIPPHITKPKERREMYLVPLPEKC